MHLSSPFFLRVGFGSLCCALLAAISASAQFSFVNYESPHVHPLDLSGNTLVACNTAANRLEVFDVSTGVPVQIDSIPVGYDPVSARFRTATEVWVVNQISDTVSVVNLSTSNVKATIHTADEPADVVFGDSSFGTAFVSCSQADVVQRFDVLTYASAGADIEIDGEDPRALGVTTDGNTVFVAVFESGNHTTVLAGGVGDGTFNPGTGLINVVSDPTGPYGGISPPPNAWPFLSTSFDPSLGGAGVGPRTSLIVFKQGATWLDDSGSDWTAMVSGASAFKSNRPTGWDVLDNDVISINANTGAVSSIDTGLMNICMALGVNPIDNTYALVGTSGTNAIRFEPNITGTFTRVRVSIDGAGWVDMNDAHLVAAQFAQDGVSNAYHDGSVPQSERNKSIGDPRGIAFTPDGLNLYVTGMGSNNVVRLNASTGQRTTLGGTIEVQEGPTGIVYHSFVARGVVVETRLYVLNRFAGSITSIDASSDTVVSHTSFLDPTPDVIRTGRKHLYDTHKNSGLGQLACGSCHVDSRIDRLAWDLGNPAGALTSDNLENKFILGGAMYTDPHPMKGPMTTQTLQDIIGKEPLHWRGDKRGLEDFNGAFVGLNGTDDVGGGNGLTSGEMTEFKNYLATIHFPPNPFRDLDNSLAASVDLGYQFASGRFSGSGGLARGDAMPAGDPGRGLELYMGNPASGLFDTNMDGDANCVSCHTLPLGNGPDGDFISGSWTPIAPDADGNHHIGIVSNDGLSNKNIKVPQLRNGYDKIGMDLSHTNSRAGSGFLHDGAVDSLVSFLSSSVFDVTTDQDVADLVALMMSISGSGFESTPEFPPFGLPADTPSFQTSKDAHAAIGWQDTLLTSGDSTTDIQQRITDMSGTGEARGASLQFDLIAKGIQSGLPRGWVYASGTGTSSIFQSDASSETKTLAQLLALAGSGTEVTFTVVPTGLGERLGIDRDDDGDFDRDEVVAGRDPAFREVWVQFGFGGIEEGVFGAPFNTMLEGVVELNTGNSGDTIYLHPGGSVETITISTPMTLKAPKGAVTIGGIP